MKTQLHPRNLHRDQYDFVRLIEVCPDLQPLVFTNMYGTKTINFFDPTAVKLLNRALLSAHYGLEDWDIPAGYLCPPIPGSADYLHDLAGLQAGGATDLQLPLGEDIAV
ncbi:MAG: RlmF-related methyltransferase, partial [Saprospiraceae bacterium]